MRPQHWLLLITYLATAPYSHQSQSRHPYIDLVENPYFVDKSNLLIRIFGEFAYSHIYLTCPNHFGSTSNLNMIDLFANIELDSSYRPINYTKTKSYQIFNQSAFGQFEMYRNILESHLAQHPVIYIDLGVNLPKNFSIQSMIKYLLNAMQKAYKRYEWLFGLPQERLNCGPNRTISQEDVDFGQRVLNKRINQGGIENSLKILCRVLHKYFDRKVVILINSLDHALSHALFYSRAEVKSDTEMFDAFEILNRMVSNAIRFLPYTMSFMTGLWHAQIDANYLGNVAHHNFLEWHRLVRYFGFTEEEVDRLLVNNGCKMPERNGVVSYYNGHRMVDGETKLFSPYSITQYLEHRVKNSELYQASLKPYFFGNNETTAILKFLPIPVFRHYLVSLVNRIPIKFVPILHFERVHFEHYFHLRNNNFTCAIGYRESFAKHLLLTMVLKMGYLCYNRDRDFILPNTEIENYLANALNTFYEPESATFSEIGALIYAIISSTDQDQRTAQIYDLQSKLTLLFGRLSTIYDYTRISELEYRFVMFKSIKKHQKDSNDKGNVWTSGNQLDSMIVTSRITDATSAGVLQISCDTSAVDTLGKVMKNIRPRVSKAPITYFGIHVDEQVNVKIETSTIQG
ncbi:uncharacterized protein LOC135843289 [Planococcus citri]|uniref:uncharacterized protein LOC135843289 n=1 Tax=Planococcus citri TaxID=170843 RepID=UPI0031F99266